MSLFISFAKVSCLNGATIQIFDEYPCSQITGSFNLVQFIFRMSFFCMDPFLHVFCSSEKKNDTHGFQIENSQKTRIMFFPFVSFFYKTEKYLLIFVCNVSNYVFNKQNPTYPTLHLESVSCK